MVRSTVNLASKFYETRNTNPKVSWGVAVEMVVWGFAVGCLPDSGARSHS